jgi:uncharacterized phage-associated protein
MQATRSCPLYSALNIAAYLVESGRQRNCSSDIVVDINSYRRTRLDLVNLIYIAHGWTLALCHRPLIHEPFIAYAHGISHPALMVLLSGFENKSVKDLSLYRIPIDDETRWLLDRVEAEYGHLSTPELSTLTGGCNPVWSACNAASDLSEYTLSSWKGVVLKDADIQAHYARFLPS